MTMELPFPTRKHLDTILDITQETPYNANTQHQTSLPLNNTEDQEKKKNVSTFLSLYVNTLLSMVAFWLKKSHKYALCK